MEDNKDTVSSWAIAPSKTDGIDFDLFNKRYRAEFRKIYESNETYKGKWNWWAFLFSWIWCFASGCWVYGLIILLSLILTYGNGVYLLLALGWSIILGIRGTWLTYNVKVKQKQFPKSLF